MPYQVLARKWRPHNFDTMVGQTHVVQALKNAMREQRLHHAYLFSGTRGVGKTTIARIIAKCLNCEQGISSKPCEVCSACQEINEGRFVDLIEVDAASRTRVEDTRELLENVQYRPTRGRYKIYLIDEVHMLSGHSFNALLKTLEEPPPHVKFLLATTDPQKLPATVLSRCLQFHLKNLMPEHISAQLAHILTQEQVKFEPDALTHIAISAQGSMRDALSILDQAIAYSDGHINTTAVQNMLGLVPVTQNLALITALKNKEGNQVLTLVDALTADDRDYQAVLTGLLALLHDIAWAQILPQANDISAEIRQLAQALTGEQVQLYYQIALTGQHDLDLNPNRAGFEMVLLRMLAFTPNEHANSPSQSIAAQPPTTVNKTSAVQTHPLAEQDNTHTPPSGHNKPITTEWTAIVGQLGLHGPTLALANHCVVKKQTESTLELILDAQQAPLLNPNQRKRLNEALNRYYHTDLKLVITLAEDIPIPTPGDSRPQAPTRQKQAEQHLKTDPKLNTLLTSFNGNVLQKTINPV